MASAPHRQTYTKKRIPFSNLEEVEPGRISRSESLRSVGSEYSDAYPVEIEEMDPKLEAQKATYLEEQRALAEKARRQQRKTQKVKAVPSNKTHELLKQIGYMVKPGARVVIATKKAGRRRRRTQKKRRV